jgi:hypothetical protein
MQYFTHISYTCRGGKKYNPKCPACVIQDQAREIKRLKAALREAASRNHKMRKELRRRETPDRIGYPH